MRLNPSTIYATHGGAPILTMIPARYPAMLTEVWSPGDIVVYSRNFRRGMAMGRSCSLLGRDTFVTNDLDTALQLVCDVPPRFAFMLLAYSSAVEATEVREACHFFDLKHLGIQALHLDISGLSLECWPTETRSQLGWLKPERELAFRIASLYAGQFGQSA